MGGEERRGEKRYVRGEGSGWEGLREERGEEERGEEGVKSRKKKVKHC